MTVADRPGSIDLPRLLAEDERSQPALDASRAVVAHLLAARSSGFTVRALAEVAGLSERTFYRYFPRKEDAVRPYLEAGLRLVVERVRSEPADRPLREALEVAHAGVLDLARGGDGEALLTVVYGEDRLRAVWLQVLADAEGAFAEVIASRLGVGPVQARLAGVAVVGAGRLALAAAGEGQEPRAVFAACLDMLGAALFQRPAAGDLGGEEAT